MEPFEKFLTKIENTLEEIQKSVATLTTQVAVMQMSFGNLEKKMNSHDDDITKLEVKVQTLTQEQIALQTKFSVVWGVLGVIGTALVGVVVKLLFGT